VCSSPFGLNACSAAHPGAQMAVVFDARELNKTELEPICLIGSRGLLWARALEPIFIKSEFSTFLPQNLNFSLNDLQNVKTSKLTKYIRK